MSSIAHRIRRLTWLAKTTSASSALALRQSLRTELEYVLLPVLERVFDRFSVGDKVLRIPKLTLHVVADNSTMADLARHIEEQLVRSIEELLPKQVAESSDAIETTATTGLQDLLNVRLRPPTFHQDDWQGVTNDARSATQTFVQQQSFSEHRREVLVEYLRSGSIGWHSTAQDTTTLINWLQAEAKRLVVEQPRDERLFAGSLETRIAVNFRLLQLIAPADRVHWLGTVSLPNGAIIAELIQLARSPETSEYWQLRLTAILLALRADDLPVIRERSLGEVLAMWSLSSVAAETSASPQESKKSNFATQLPNIEPLSGETETSFKIPRLEATNFILPKSRGQEPNSSNVNPNHRVTADTEVAWRLRTMEPPPAHDVPGRVAADAGLILLHPFLPRLFEATGIAVANSRVLSSESLPTAAALLNWLVTGRGSIFELELSLSKVLLGLAPNEPLLVADGLLNQDQCDEADAMLAAAIDHWSALRQTSLAGLRTSFLQRRGLLRDDELSWRLRVETVSFDLLLGQLPWSITAVKLPWMTKPIYTDWPTP